MQLGRVELETAGRDESSGPFAIRLDQMRAARRRSRSGLVLVLEEDVVVAWHGSRCGEESVKTAVQPIIDWLQEASEEESDEEEEGGDD